MTDPISNFIKSKILGLASLLLLIASMATITAVFLPFWFSLHMHLQFVEDEKPQQTSIDRSINCGLFFLDENRFVNTIMLDKADNTHFMPGSNKNLQIIQTVCYIYHGWSKFRSYNFVLHNLITYNMKMLWYLLMYKWILIIYVMLKCFIMPPYFFFSSAESCPVTVPAGKHWYRPLLWVRIHPGIQAVCNSFWGNVLGSWSNWILWVIGILIIFNYKVSLNAYLNLMWEHIGRPIVPKILRQNVQCKCAWIEK